MQLSSAVLLALVAAHLAQAYETYPFPSFFKTMDPDDPYLNGFCLTTGEPSIAQTTGDDKYDSYNPCTVGEVGLWSSGQSFLPNRLGVGMISNSTCVLMKRIVSCCLISKKKKSTKIKNRRRPGPRPPQRALGQVRPDQRHGPVL